MNFRLIMIIIIAMLLPYIFIGVNASITGNVVYSGYEDSSEHLSGVENIVFLNELEQQTIEGVVTDNIIFKTAYVSFDGKAWIPFSLQGNEFKGSNEWLNQTASISVFVNSSNFELNQSRLFSDDNYIIIYSCSLVNNNWDCHNNSWQIKQFNSSLIEELGNQGLSITATESEHALWANVNLTIDGNHSDDSRWSAEGNNQWIQYEFSQEIILDEIQINFLEHDNRRSTIIIETSLDSNNWNEEFSGQSSIIPQEQIYESFSFIEKNLKYVKITGNGNSENTWNSIIEVRFLVNNTIVAGENTTPVTEPNQTNQTFVCGDNSDNVCPEEDNCIFSIDNDCPECKLDSQCNDNNICTIDSCNSNSCSNTLTCVSDGECCSSCASDPDCTSPPASGSSSENYLIHNQEFVIPGDAQNNDVVGFLNQFWNDFKGIDADYTIIGGNSQNIFSINNEGKILVSNAGNLNYQSTTQHIIKVQATNTQTSSTANANITITVLNPSNIYYIDPDASSSGTGSRASPYNSWYDVMSQWGRIAALQDNYAYLQKRGTSFDSNDGFYVDGSPRNILFGAYGSSDSRPLIRETNPSSFVFGIAGGNDITIRDLEIEVTGSQNAGGIIVFEGSNTMNPRNNNDNMNNIVDNVRVQGIKTVSSCLPLDSDGEGISSQYGGSGIKIFNSEVADICNDGIFLKDMRDAEVAFNYIHDVNTYWFTDPTNGDEHSGGDGIQITSTIVTSETNGIGTPNIHHNIIDHSTTGDKFCTLFYSEDSRYESGKYNYNYCNHGNHIGFTAYGNLENVEVTYNHFKNDNLLAMPSESFAMDIRTANTLIAYNIIDGFRGGMRVFGGSTKVYNNIIYDASDVLLYINGGNNEIINNIFNYQSGGGREFLLGYPSYTASNNIFFPDTPAGFSSSSSLTQDPSFVDATNGDFHLDSGSQAINQGIDVGLYKDYDGNSVSGNPDIGAYEYQE